MLARTIFRAGLAITLVSSLAACGDQSNASQPSMHPAQVTTKLVQFEAVPYVVSVPATLVAEKEVEVRARVSGVIEQRKFEPGQTVQQGESLFAIDSKPYQLDYKKQLADLEVSKARLAQAERNVKRLKPLKQKNSVSQQQYDDALSQRDIAQAEVKSAKVRLQQAKLNLEYSQVLAPISGVIGKEKLSIGNFVSGAGVVLTSITQDDTMKVEFGLSARQQLTMQKQAEAGLLSLPADQHWQVKLKLSDGSYYQKTGFINFADVKVSRQTATSAYQARIKNVAHTLKSGQFVTAELHGATREQVVVLPQKAVLDNGTGKYVYLVAKNDKGMTIAKPQPVQVAEWQPKTTNWVILSGLKAGDKVIVEGMAHIFFPGMPVQENTTAKTASH